MSRPKLVARYLDGRIRKGYSEDFDPHRPTFHIREEVGEGLEGRAIPIRREELKALFFVKTFGGNPLIGSGRSSWRAIPAMV